MPIFYIVSGFIAGKRHPEGMDKEKFPAYFARKSQQILIPYFVFGLLLICFFQGLHILAGEPLNVGQQLFRLISMQGIESMWFLTRYLIADLFFLFVYERLKRPVRMCAAILSIAAITVISVQGMPSFWLLRVLMGAWIGLIFIYFGFVLSRYDILKRLRSAHMLAVVAVSILLATYNGFIGVGALQLQNPVLFFLDAFGISAGIIAYCDFQEKRCGTHRVLKTFEENTIIVVCTNNLIIEVVRLLDYKFTGSILIRMGLMGTLVCVSSDFNRMADYQKIDRKVGCCIR